MCALYCAFVSLLQGIFSVPVKKTVIKYDPKIFALYRSALVEHMKGVKGKPPVMLFVSLAVALFAIVQLGSYVKAHGGIIPKPKVSQSQENEEKNEKRNEVKNEKRPSFLGSPSPSPSGSSPTPSVSVSSPSYSYPSSYPSVSSGASSFPSSPSASPSLPSPSPPIGGYGYIVIEVARPSARQSDYSPGLELFSGPKVVEIP